MTQLWDLSDNAHTCGNAHVCGYMSAHDAIDTIATQTNACGVHTYMLSPQDVLPRQTWHDRNLLYKFVRIVCENIMCGYLQMCNNTCVGIAAQLNHMRVTAAVWELFIHHYQ